MGYFTKKEQVVILVLIIAMLGLLGYNIKYKDDPQFKRQEQIDHQTMIKQENKEDDRVAASHVEIADEDDQIKTNDGKPDPIFVHIGGEVLYPGVFKLQEGDRLIDGVTLAGGPTQAADLDLVNLAAKLEDGSKVYIPREGEIPVEEIMLPTSTNTSSKNAEKHLGKTNINTATLEELKSLSGVGDAIAQRIIEFRMNQTFKRVEDIKKVSGIGEKKFEAIRDAIVID